MTCEISAAQSAAEAAHVATSQAITHLNMGIKTAEDADRVRGLVEQAQNDLEQVARIMLSLVVSGPVEA